MSATLSLVRPTVLVIHDDGEALDVLTRLFEASGFQVTTAVGTTTTVQRVNQTRCGAASAG